MVVVLALFVALGLAQAGVATAGAIPAAAPDTTPAPVLSADACRAYQDGAKQCYTHTVTVARARTPYALCPLIVNQCRAEWLLDSTVVEVPCPDACCATTATTTVSTAGRACPTACTPIYTQTQYAYAASCSHDRAAVTKGSAADRMVNAVHGETIHDIAYALAKRGVDADTPSEPAEHADEDDADDADHHRRPKPFPPLRPPPHHHKPPPNQPGIVITTKPVFTIPTWAPNLPTMVTLTHATHAPRMAAPDRGAPSADEDAQAARRTGAAAGAGPDHTDTGNDSANAARPLGTARPTDRRAHHAIHGEPPLPAVQY